MVAQMVWSAESEGRETRTDGVRSGYVGKVGRFFARGTTCVESERTLSARRAPMMAARSGSAVLRHMSYATSNCGEAERGLELVDVGTCSFVRACEQ